MCVLCVAVSRLFRYEEVYFLESHTENSRTRHTHHTPLRATTLPDLLSRNFPLDSHFQNSEKEIKPGVKNLMASRTWRA
jgi:hypothetical protein